MFVLIRAAEHSQAWFDHFAATVRAIPSVTEFHRTSGDVDYLLKLQLADVASYDEVYKLLVGSTRCAEVRAAFSMEDSSAPCRPAPRARRLTGPRQRIDQCIIGR